MTRLCGMLSYWSGCLAVVVFALGLLCVPSDVARADLGGGGGTAGLVMCITNLKPPYGCANAGAMCPFYDQTGLCGPSPNQSNCTCNPAIGPP